jgi:hypothetical protein
LEEYDDDEEEGTTFGPEMIPKGVLSEEQEGAITEIIADGQSEIVEDIAEFFIHWPLVSPL